MSEKQRLAAAASWRDPVVRARHIAAIRIGMENRRVFLKRKKLSFQQLERLGGESCARAARHALRDLREENPEKFSPTGLQSG